MASEKRSDISPVLNAVTEALTQVYPQCRYKPQEPFMYLMSFLGTHPPEFVYDGMIRLLGYLSSKVKKRK
ncbi:hypothetical protein SK128_004421 [Halocaridina rubra]|uniref:Uncharacterized protein n=1 Tax=Halocaridina rubra TaxID=373956 RepID=A0AAN9AB65_HALRR